MNENLDLRKILKGHEGERFYSPFYGQVTLRSVEDEGIVIDEYDYLIQPDGVIHFGGECMIFPSKTKRDWNQWSKKQSLITWDKIVPNKYSPSYRCEIYPEHDGNYDNYQFVENCGDSLIEKSAMALMKIHYLIENFYGGFPDQKKDKDYAGIQYDLEENKFIIEEYWESDITLGPNLDFKSGEFARHFLESEENIKLLKDYFMIRDN